MVSHPVVSHPVLAFPQPDSAAISNHNVANSLSIVAGLVRMQASSLRENDRSMGRDEVRLVLEELGARVETVARLHRLLSDAASETTIELGHYLKDISGAIVSALSVADNVDLQFDCDNLCRVSAQKALPIGLIVVELVTNAVKYAHPSGIAGKIRIGCGRTADGMVLVEVSDDGVGLPEGLDPRTDGRLGLRLVRLLAEQVVADISFESGPLGLSLALRMPLGTLDDVRRREGPMTNTYRCYFTDEGNRIKSVEQIESADDAGAALKVEHLLGSSQYSWAELWQGKRQVGKWGNGKGSDSAGAPA